jgi:hypothetical protein
MDIDVGVLGDRFRSNQTDSLGGHIQTRAHMRGELAVLILATDCDVASEVDALGFSPVAQERVKGTSVILQFFYDHTTPSSFLYRW